jgi:pyridoxamine 5'-phosphate oxidase
MTHHPDPAPHVSIADRRVSYDVGSLELADLASTPLEQFLRWFDQAVAGGVPEPNAMTLATLADRAVPAARTVLLKQADARGFVFFTNYTSRKGTDLDRSPGAALVFGWLTLHRQVAVRGLAERVPAAETAAYFGSRPWGSRIGAWASHQSRPVPDRQALDQRYAELAARWPDHGRDDDVPVPLHWGGFVVRPFEVEFWQGRPSRLHDRLVFCTRSGEPAALDDAAAWRIERLEP